ncbi:MAG TPA: alpha/beta hydrolase [Polyangiaceae bacterium]
MKRQTFLVLCAMAAMGCESGKKADLPGSAQSALPKKAPPPTPSRTASFKSGDAVFLKGTLYLAEDPAAPLLVFVHRMGADRREWAPLAERLRRGERRYTMVNFDLSRHGESNAALDPRKVDGGEQANNWVRDIRSAIGFGMEATGKKARAVVLAGSSLGAALITQVALDEPKVVAMALVSPGGAIQGYSIYRRFAAVRALPSFLAASESDTVTADAFGVLCRMAGEAATSKLYPGNAHGAENLARAGPALWNDLEPWLMRVYDAPPRPRHLLDPEPAPRAAKGHRPTVGR